MTKKFCPYPGLRPFTVDESIFFKGRDLHIRQIISKLEEKRILILTGASGDGKSSLVYAGVIPNARAGFFRAKYNNWLFVAFRPERTPFHNLAADLAAHLQLDTTHCENELSYGFSALVDLYKSSEFYIDEESEKWKNTSEPDKKKRRQKAANLFILADQFEEFFTNTENFNNGKPTNNAYTTVNLLLETAKIAFRDNLPIYVICTMRSDFISQSVAFRGLPETIGFSQFFVPRLNRNELQQVIEEPATLSGGVVSKRLKEVLINELHDGFDQLPLLQHTLKQLWEYADGGNEEIDLIHLAKLGGIHPRFLTEEDQKKFNIWYESLDEVHKKYLETPSAYNVLNAHANFLYDTSFDYFTKNIDWAGKNITDEEAKHIIKIAFQSLVKIDQGRAVRSRMTLREITSIISKPHIKYETVCGVLNIFRLQGSTFLYPFINENDISSQYLGYDTVLDITHEALIRNWENLKAWNEEEYDNLSNFSDFNIQLQRWVVSSKSDGYLLAIGPLSYFEEWYNRCKPNKYWLAKYDTSTVSFAEKVVKADLLAENTRAFLESSRAHIIAIEKAQRRRRRILFASTTLVILILLGFTYWAMQEKQAAQKQKQIAEQQTDTARYQQKLAMEANQIAKQEKLKAEENAQKALFAKNQSDSARTLAETLRLLADRQTQLAKRETENAKSEKQKADAQSKIADSQRKIADDERKKAVSASDSAKTLSYLAIAQSLSFKAIQKFDDKQVNLLLALQAYHFNKKYGGYERFAGISFALRFALENFGLKNLVFTSPSAVSSFFVSSKSISVLNKNCDLVKFDMASKKTESQTKLFQTEIPINNSFFITENLIVVCFENKDLYLFNTETNKPDKLNGHSDFVRAVAIGADKQTFATASRDKTIRLWRISNLENYQTINVEARPTAIVFSKDSKTLYACTNEGSLLKINLSDNKSQKINRQKTAIYSMQLSPNGAQLGVGYADGNVRVFDIQNNFKMSEISASNTGIRCISYSNDSKIIATVSDDKVVQILDLKYLDQNADMIDKIYQKMIGLYFEGEKIFVLTTNNTILSWESNPANAAEQVRKILTRNFTHEEWKIFVGEKIPYETTK